MSFRKLVDSFYVYGVVVSIAVYSYTVIGVSWLRERVGLPPIEIE